MALKNLEIAVPRPLTATPASSAGGSPKSDKNMADFEGEDFMSDEELARIHEFHSSKPAQAHSSNKSPTRSPRSPVSSPAGNYSR